MTINTGAVYLRMINRTGRYRCPGGWEFLVTGIAHIRGRNMIGTLAARRHTIVTGNTVTGEWRMIHIRWYPRGCSMTGIALSCGRNVIRRFTRCGCAIMAA